MKLEMMTHKASSAVAVDAAPARLPGRPRSEEARKSILKAAYRLLRKSGVEGVSTHHIAEEAGVSTATLYRWWDTKEAILLDAYVEHHREQWPYPKTGSPLARLRQHAIRTTQFLKSEDGRVFLRLIMAIQEDTALRAALFEKLYLPRRAEARAVVEEAISMGELPPTTKIDLLIEFIHAPQFRRLFIGNDQLDEDFAVQVFDFAIAAATSTAAPRGKQRGTH
jgi:AcrR family transcriptional regulator